MHQAPLLHARVPAQDIKVTPKGIGGVKPLPVTLIAPMLLLSCAGGVSLLASSSAVGSFMTAVYAYIYWVSTVAVVALHWHENGFGKTTLWQRACMLAPATVALIITGVVVTLGAVRVAPNMLW